MFDSNPWNSPTSSGHNVDRAVDKDEPAVANQKAKPSKKDDDDHEVEEDDNCRNAAIIGHGLPPVEHVWIK